ncbi:hypothetical protein LXL04_023495 [Taraxacum kok-saghyz]
MRTNEREAAKQQQVVLLIETSIISINLPYVKKVEVQGFGGFAFSESVIFKSLVSAPRSRYSHQSESKGFVDTWSSFGSWFHLNRLSSKRSNSACFFYSVGNLVRICWRKHVTKGIFGIMLFFGLSGSSAAVADQGAVSVLRSCYGMVLADYRADSGIFAARRGTFGKIFWVFFAAKDVQQGQFLGLFLSFLDS